MFVFEGVRRLSLRCVVLCGLVLVVGNVCGQQFNGNIVDLDSGGIQTFQGQTIDRDRDHRERMANYERISAEMSASINAMRQQGEMRNQTRELREQTELLRNMSEERSGESSTSYVPPPIIVAPPSYVPPTSSVPQESKEERAAREKRFLDNGRINQAMELAQKAKSFDARTKKPLARQLSSEEGSAYENRDVPNNSDFIKSLLQSYGGHFTDYKWTVEKVDEQTYIAKCQVTLDGEQNEFRFRVNPLVGTCRYESGTALDKISPPRKFIPLDENGKPLGGDEWWKEVEPIETWGENDPVVSE